MHKTLIVKGMMCPHCEAHCRESLEKVDGVVSAKGDHNACTAEVELSREVAEDALKAAVKAAGYEYGGMKG